MPGPIFTALATYAASNPQAVKAAAQLVPQLIGAGMSYAQAAQQKKLMKEAEGEAAKALTAARAKLAEAPLQRVQVPTEAYQNAMQQITAQSMQATQATQEAGARELAASVGRIGAMGLTAAEQQREAMAQDIYKRDIAVAYDEARRLKELAEMDKLEALGAQLSAAQAQNQMGAALTSATTGLGLSAGKFIENLPLFLNTGTGAEGVAGTGATGASAGMFGSYDPNAPMGGWGNPMGYSPQMTVNVGNQSMDPRILALYSQIFRQQNPNG